MRISGLKIVLVQGILTSKDLTPRDQQVLRPKRRLCIKLNPKKF
jgi:hypothetical protein